MTQSFAPKWLRIASIIFALLAFIVAGTLIIAPASALTEVDLQAKGVKYLTQMWAARQFAMGAIFAVAAWKNSTTLISLCFIFFLVMNVGDFLIGLSQRDNGLIIGALVMCVISGIMLILAQKGNA